MAGPRLPILTLARLPACVPSQAPHPMWVANPSCLLLPALSCRLFFRGVLLGMRPSCFDPRGFILPASSLGVGCAHGGGGWAWRSCAQESIGGLQERRRRLLGGVRWTRLERHYQHRGAADLALQRTHHMAGQGMPADDGARWQRQNPGVAAAAIPATSADWLVDCSAAFLM